MKKIIWVLEITADLLFPQKSAVKNLKELTALEIARKIPAADTVKGHENSFFALFPYRHPLAKQIVWEIKYRGNLKLAAVIGQLLSNKIHEQPFSHPPEKTIIIPIPISKKRLKQRGFSQTELISKSLVEGWTKNFQKPAGQLLENFSYRPDVLVKIKETPPQASLDDRAERLTNLSGAFGLRSEECRETICGKNIILIDDVITTGATLEEARGVLLDAGAKSVFGFAIAH